MGVVRVCGEQHGMSRLKDADVRDIKRRLGEGQSGASIARLHGVSQQTISKIKAGSIWSHISIGEANG